MATMMTTMMTGLLLLLLAGVTVSRVVDLDKRVYNGVACGDKVRLYHVRLRTFDEQGLPFASGGSLISPGWILTAAHNVPPGERVTAILGFHPGPGKTVTITEEPIRYSDPDGSGNHDIALLKLPDANHGYPHALLTDCSNAPKIDKDKVQIAGIGATGADTETNKKGGPLQTTLQCGDTQVVECEKICDTANISPYNKNEKLFCYHDTNVDASVGDSGGGVVFGGMIYGVHIRGGDYACETTASAINICDPIYKKWINDNTHIGIL